MKISTDFEGHHWWAFETDKPPGCQAKQGMGSISIHPASLTRPSPNLFNNPRAAGAWRRGRILQGASWILQKHRVHAIRWQQKSFILLEDKKGKGNGKDLSKSGRLLEWSMPESLNFSLIVCCVLFLMNLLQSRIDTFKKYSNASDDSAPFCLRGKQWSLWQPVICKWGAGGKVANVASLLLQDVFWGHSDFIRFWCTVWFRCARAASYRTQMSKGQAGRRDGQKYGFRIRLLFWCVADSKFSLSGYRILDVSYPHSDSLAHSFVLVVSCCSAFHINIGNFLHERTAKPATASFQSSSWNLKLFLGFWRKTDEDSREKHEKVNAFLDPTS